MGVFYVHPLRSTDMKKLLFLFSYSQSDYSVVTTAISALEESWMTAQLLLEVIARNI